nr:FapA family protein [Lachnospiraceae bacterium]
VYKNKDMEAYIVLKKPPKGVEYSRSDIANYMASNNLKAGIKEARIIAVLKKKIYDREVLIAEGTPAVEGKDGYFEYTFDPDMKRKQPLIREDGSVDYSSLNVIECVNEGDLLATYHPAIKGKPGMSCKGVVVKATPARDIRPYFTKGCVYDEQTMTYTATTGGRIELTKGKLAVISLQEYTKDLDNVYGNVDFKGDILIHGSVKPGIKITATKSVTIDGTLEGSSVCAGGDVIIKGGILGGETSVIECGGDMMADFIEYASLNVKGDISANIFLNCNVVCIGRVYATGKMGAIVGGNVYGMAGVECVIAGNDVGLRTVIAAGVRASYNTERTTKVRNIDLLTEQIATISTEADEIERLRRLGTADDVQLERKKELMREKISLDAQLMKERERLEELTDYMDGAEGCNIIINDTLYPGSIVQLGVQQMVIDEEKRKAQFKYDDKRNMILKPIIDWG